MDRTEIERLIRTLMRSNVSVSYEYAVVRTALYNDTFRIFTTNNVETWATAELEGKPADPSTAAQVIASTFTALSRLGWDVCETAFVNKRFSSPSQDAWLIRRAIVRLEDGHSRANENRSRRNTHG